MIHVFWKKLYMLYGVDWFPAPDSYSSPHKMEYWNTGTSDIFARISGMMKSEYIEFNTTHKHLIKFTQKFTNEIEKE